VIHDGGVREGRPYLQVPCFMRRTLRERVGESSIAVAEAAALTISRSYARYGALTALAAWCAGGGEQRPGRIVPDAGREQPSGRPLNRPYRESGAKKT
jgi:hypothetical protein